MPRCFVPLCVLVVAAIAVAAVRPCCAADESSSESPTAMRLYIGTYTGGKSKGIYLAELNLTSGVLKSLGLAAAIDSPSFLAIHPSRKFLYAANEIATFDKKPTGAVTAFAIDAASGLLKRLNQKGSGGTGPCHLIVDRAGKNVLVANYGGGSVAALPIASDGTLGDALSVIQHEGSSVNATRQEAPHAHSINLDAANRFAVAADLGLDQLLVYRFDAAKGTLSANDPPAISVAKGSGPRHFAFHTSGKFAYVINELKSTVAAFAYDADRGTLKELQTISTLPDDYKGNSFTAEVVVHPSGKFLYGSNRGHDSIAVFAIDEKTGKLTAVEQTKTGGKTPRNFAVDPTGAYLLAANQSTNTINVFRVNAETGKLTPTDNKLDAPSPVCLRMIPR